MTRHSSTSNKLRNVNTVRGRTGTSSLEKGKLLYQNQSHRACHKYLDETNPFEIDKCNSRNGASASEALALFYCNSDG